MREREGEVRSRWNSAAESFPIGEKGRGEGRGMKKGRVGGKEGGRAGGRGSEYLWRKHRQRGWRRRRRRGSRPRARPCEGVAREGGRGESKQVDGRE